MGRKLAHGRVLGHTGPKRLRVVFLADLGGLRGKVLAGSFPLEMHIGGRSHGLGGWESSTIGTKSVFASSSSSSSGGGGGCGGGRWRRLFVKIDVEVFHNFGRQADAVHT